MAKRGETREKILNIATKVFFEHGFEATSVKMILDEADVVTGSFYHFFPSKEALFESVVEKYLQDYTQKVCSILSDETLSIDVQFNLFMSELQNASKTYYNELQGNKLHWTMQHALHNKTVEAMVLPLSEMLGRHIKAGTIQSRLDVDTVTLAAIIIKSIEAIIHGNTCNASNIKEPALVKEQITGFVRLIFDFN
ncbi:MAG: TetR/AcrR family transcriptional regulator [Lachnospiraceae bacterium]